MQQVTFVIPCFNEEHRLAPEAVAALLAAPELRVLFVDDGSRDGTARLLEQLCQRHDRASFLSLPNNRGKAEAVRAGLLDAAARTPWVGYADADFATPPAELIRLAQLATSGGDDIVIGARVAVAGSRIERRPTRHYLGRIFGTVAATMLGVRIYDTQCGAKLFRVTPTLRAALAEPFTTRWIFDVELLGRLLRADPPARLREVPLDEWRDVAGSKLRLSAMLQVPAELVRVGLDLRKRRG